MHIAICDDNRADAQRLMTLLAGDHTAAVFPSAEALLLELDAGERFDLYLLDIFMGGMDGVELAGSIRALDEDALLCFTTTSTDFYPEAYRLYAFQYLVKPVERETFQELLRRASDQLTRDRERRVTLFWRGRTRTVPYGRILFIASRGHALYVQCKEGRIEQSGGRLEELAGQLDGNVFVRCHQSYIVNLYNMDALDGDDFLCGDCRVPISRRYAEVKELYRALLFEEMR